MDEIEQIQQWCHDNLERGELSAQITQMVEELAELSESVKKSQGLEKEVEELGDIGIVWIALCHQRGFPPLTALQAAYNKIKDRDGEMKNGRFVKEEDL